MRPPLSRQIDLQPRQDSNLDQAFRKRLFYPLNYGAPRTN